MRPDLSLATARELPTFTIAGHTLYQRLTLVVEAGRVRHCFFPMPDPSGHADEVVRRLHEGR